MPDAKCDPQSSQMPRTVLLVEDNALIAMSTAEQLRELGVEDVVVCPSVIDAQNRCERHRFDFALLDFNLAQGTSVDLARALRDAGTRFAFASGFAKDLELPADLCDCLILSKPYFISDLSAALRGA